MKKENCKNLQLIVYILCGILLISGIFIGYKFNQISKKNTSENDKLLQKINLLTNNYKRDSTEFVKINSISLSKMKQELRDSVVINFALFYSKKIEEKNNNNTTSEKSKEKEEKEITSKYANVTTYTQLPNYKAKNHTLKRKEGQFTSNVTTYTKLKNNEKKNNGNYSANVTTYTKLPNYKVDNYKQKNHTSKLENVSTYTKLNPRNITNNKAAKIATKRKLTKINSNKNSIPITKSKIKKSNTIYHGIPALDEAININTVGSVPIYPGCESKLSEKSRKNCLEAKVSSYVYGKFNLSVIKNLGIKKGFHELRVLFVIDQYGKSKGVKAIGSWHPRIKTEAIRVVNTLPKMTAGKKNNQNINVKYSIKIPFIVK